MMRWNLTHQHQFTAEYLEKCFQVRGQHVQSGLAQLAPYPRPNTLID